MFILSRYVKSCGLKMVLSGEGADEVFGGYLYFHEAPNNMEFHLETVSLLRRLQFSECLRANKSTMAWGVELRVPFLGTDFLNTAMQIRPSDRMPQKVLTKKLLLVLWFLKKIFFFRMTLTIEDWKSLFFEMPFLMESSVVFNCTTIC